MNKLIITTLLVLCFGNTIAQNKRTPLQRKIKGTEKALITALETSKASGFAVAIVKGDEIVYSKGFGYRDYENKLPVTPNTVFAIGSTTKAFTASLIGILQDEGKLDINESPRTYLPELKFYNSEMDAQITIKDLMTHRTGLPRHDGSSKIFKTQSKDEIITRIKFLVPVAPVRSKWIYNNTMYMVQGVIAERLTEQTWVQNIEKRLFEPLEMKNSNTSISALQQNNQAAIGYYFEDGKRTPIDYYDIAALGPAGAINSSVNDMSKWMIAWLNGGLYHGKQVLPSNYVKQAISSQMVISGRLPKESAPNTFMGNYGFGWFTSSYKGHYRVDHGGNIDGFSASIALYPGDDLGIVVLSNQNQSAIAEIVRNIIADEIFDVSKTNWIEKLDKFVQRQIKVQEIAPIVSIEPALALNDYTGNYVHKGYGTFGVIEKNDSLFAEFPSKTLWLNPIHPNVFETYYVVENQVEAKYQDKSINFKITVDGAIYGLEMKLERTLAPIEFTRVVKKE